MREIEFRAYHPSTNDMVFFSGKDFCDQHIAHHFGLLLQNKHPEGTDLLMQFTGLRDKNGVKIFEGDIIDDHIGRGVVEFSDNYGAFKVNYKNGIGKWFIDYSLRGERESIEVIGNIHQHPNLLEK